MKTAELTPVVSSQIKAVGARGTDLFIQFKGWKGKPDAIYRYWSTREGDDVTRHAAEMSKEGVSPGKYFDAEIRSKYPYSRLPDDPAAEAAQ